MSDLEIIDNNEPSFEDFKKENGIVYWWASDLLRMLGYKDMKSFQSAMDRATKACISVNIPHYDNILAHQREVDGQLTQDFKLTRFACYLIVMNADPKKAEVAAAQIYFAEQTRKFEILIQNTDDFERILIREEIKGGNKSLGAVIKAAGILDYAKFANAGYRGLYNMLNTDLAKKRHIAPKDLMEYMGRTELAANLFRITQTEERIKNHNVKGQANLERTHFNVGREVRNMVSSNTNKTPENLPMERKIPSLQKELKDGYKKMLKQDKPTKSKKKPE